MYNSKELCHQNTPSKLLLLRPLGQILEPVMHHKLKSLPTPGVDVHARPRRHEVERDPQEVGIQDVFISALWRHGTE